jgi:hypothetical protein
MKTGRDRMDVGVLEARQQGPAAQVDHSRVRTGQRRDVSVVPDGDDPATGHGHGLGRRPHVIDGPDMPTVEDDVDARGGHGGRV